MTINRWWANDPREVYWLETTERDDIGNDLHTPQLDEGGHEHHGYSQINEVLPEAVVLHYDKNARAIVGSSRASGEVFEGETVWLSHAASARRAGLHEYHRPGWFMSLDGFTELEPPISLAQLRASEESIREVRDALRVRVRGPLYFPWSCPTKDL